ncbi:hypothetical protein AXG93_369s1440 [Marchantia polymorpha subsp. ruderalis]|uniref:Uncharacterized protein n=1 Tax=Marchantia polymorpha subsp. ruderalis TaxID=1480154 RepID=A0A176VSQ8_MARPO|nr:hypothetical protein AXG93_369s1440 [Marchantia polymorpha subsp. ruderalis]
MSSHLSPVQSSPVLESPPTTKASSGRLEQNRLRLHGPSPTHTLEEEGHETGKSDRQRQRLKLARSLPFVPSPPAGPSTPFDSWAVVGERTHTIPIHTVQGSAAAAAAAAARGDCVVLRGLLRSRLDGRWSTVMSTKMSAEELRVKLALRRRRSSRDGPEDQEEHAFEAGKVVD